MCTVEWVCGFISAFFFFFLSGFKLEHHVRIHASVCLALCTFSDLCFGLKFLWSKAIWGCVFVCACARAIVLAIRCGGCVSVCLCDNEATGGREQRLTHLERRGTLGGRGWSYSALLSPSSRTRYMWKSPPALTLPQHVILFTNIFIMSLI